jgi:hypothetical protein
MNPSQKIFLKASGFGAGVLIALVVAISTWFYISSLPEKPKPWDRESIKATNSGINVNIGDKVVITFRYLVENKTKKDYYFPDDTKGTYVVLPKGKGLSQQDEITWDSDAYLPSGPKMSVSFYLTYDYDESYQKKDQDNTDKLIKFMNSHLKEVDGFVVFDKKNRYEIVFPILFPKGWKDTAEKIK